MNSPFLNIPYELRLLPQWAISNENKNPMSTDGTNIFFISVTDPRYWLSFDQAVYYSKLFNLDIGFILHESDPFTCIDLDIIDEQSQRRKNQPIDETKWSTQEDFNRYWSMIQKFNSYTEVSKYGKGLHIWVKGNIGPGMRRDGVEVYSQERYIICTGKVINNLPIAEHQETLDKMQSQMRPKVEKTGLEELPEIESDMDIIDRAMSASNADKFNALCSGDWSGYPSQSEADLALMSMFTFYSQSNIQCKRLFRMSALGTREKATKNDSYLNNTLKTIRSREAKQDVVNTSQIQIAAQLALEIQHRTPHTEFLHTPYNTNDEEHPKPVTAAFLEMIASDNQDEEEFKSIEYPPGVLGSIAKYIYNSAPRPVKEVAIVAAIGLIAGICGKAWTITQSGLNIYMILVARSGIGKEQMHSGISNLMVALGSANPQAMEFVNFNNFASGQALTKQLAETPCFVNVSGEWGRRLSRLADDSHKDSSMDSLRTTMTDLYQKSGPKSIAGGISYSDKTNNTESVIGVSYSLIGETTPNTFYDCLTDSMMSDGFLSRFSIIEYGGCRKALNENKIMEPNQIIINHLAAMCAQANNCKDNPVQINRTESVAFKMAAFEKECDAEINGSEDESWRQMWNRASLKALKLAALSTVASDFIFPVIKDHDWDWALSIVRKDIELFSKKIKGGDIGRGDMSRENKLLSILEEYLYVRVASSYKVSIPMKTIGIVTRKYLQQRTHQASAFSKFPGGCSKALDLAIKSLIDNGNISEVSQMEMIQSFDYHGKAYRILTIEN